MVIAEVEEVFLKYKPEEDKIENVLCIKETTRKEPSSTFTEIPKISFEEVKKRNQQILKELEFVKGNLRAKSIFSPIELQWEKVCQEYQNNPSLPVTTWHCHLPVFV